ncbi:ABC transporter permease [Mesorhizobium sp. B2-4-13]|nr:ABC transporter permease [Mesorhizobium sp. B2-4-13]
MTLIIRIFSVTVLALLVLPIIIIVPLSFTSSSLLTLPVPGWSLKWYEEFFFSENWRVALINSLILGTLSTLLAAPLGTGAAIGLMRAPPRARGLLAAILMLPLIVPTIIFAVSGYFAWSRLGLVNSFAGLMLGHCLISVPFMMLTVMAGLRRFDFGLMRAAASLGASPVASYRSIFLPLMAPAILGGSLLAFAISFDDAVVALFLSGPETRTLPRQLFSNVRDNLSPVVAVAAVAMTIISISVMGASQLASRKRTP